MTGIRRIPLLLVLCCVSLAAHPQDFSGQYALRDTAEAADLVFERNDDGTYTGTLGNEGFEVVLNGEIADGMLLGMDFYVEGVDGKIPN